jgi:hypothetical protein
MKKFIFSVGSDIVSAPGFEHPDVAESLARYADRLADAVRETWPDAVVGWAIDPTTGYTIQWHTLPSDDHVERVRELADAVWSDSDEWYTDERQSALAAHLSVPVGDVTGEGDEWSHGRQEWLILSDEDADERCSEAIRDSLWAFRTDFLRRHVTSVDALEALDGMRGKVCERSNPIVIALIRDIDYLIEDAIRADGRGHFLAGYDHEEHEENGWYLYRVG